MPWKALSVLDHRREFVRLAQSGEVRVAALCRCFGISRQTGFILLRRSREEGEAGLAGRSRRPLSSPRQVLPEMAARILELRAEHPRWGGRKPARRLRDLGLPAPSTVTEVLRRAGQLDPAEAARRKPFTRCEREAPNDLWQIDFKGHFATGAGRCHPLTVLDDHSRYSLSIAACGRETLVEVQQRMTGLFRQYGLPGAILCDNGSPWGAAGQPAHGLRGLADVPGYRHAAWQAAPPADARQEGAVPPHAGCGRAAGPPVCGPGALPACVQRLAADLQRAAAA